MPDDKTILTEGVLSSSPVKYRQYKHGGARFYTVDDRGVERLLADTYNAEATERVATALIAEKVNA